MTSGSFFKFSFAKGLPFVFGVMGVLFAGRAFAASSFDGYLVDRMCEATIQHEHKDPTDALAHHTKDCSLNPECSEAGYSLYSKGKFIDLDSKSNAAARKYFQSTSKKEGHYVAVTGDMKRDLLSVESIKDAAAPAKK